MAMARRAEGAVGRGSGAVRHYGAAIRKSITGKGGGRRHTAESRWFWDHYEVAAKEIVDFCRGDGVTLDGLEIADVGCGDGIMALGLCHRARPKALIGFDVVPTNAELLVASASVEGVAESLPAELSFQASTPTEIPAADDSFDFVYSWSAFEHIEAPFEVLSEIRRIVRPDGAFFLQLWPFYHSARGSHLWDWFDDEFHHLRASDDEIVAQVRASGRHSETWTEYMLREFQTLNRATLADLQDAVQESGFSVRRLELLAAPATMMPGLERYPWADLGISGIKLIASPLR